MTHAASFGQLEWERYAAFYDSLSALRPYQALAETIARKLGVIRGPMLDLGCGTGYISSRIQSRNPAVPLTLIDRSQEMLARARVRCPTAECIEHDLSAKLPFRDARFSAIAATSVLYALPDPQAFLAEVRRVLAPGGRFIAVTPKCGYENGLILRAHARSTRPRTYWLGLHASPRRERKLVTEAVGTGTLRSALVGIARFNRSIASAPFCFFTRSELEKIVLAAGFIEVRVSLVYARQSFCLTARRA